MILAAMLIGNDYYTGYPCAQVDYTLGGEAKTRELYPDCDAFYSGANPNQHVMVHATFSDGPGTLEADDMTRGAALGVAFGPAIWLALAIHAVGIEIYVSSYED